MWRNRSPSLQQQRGVAAVELGILLVPLVLLVAGVSEYGRAIQNYNLVVKSTRVAVRYLTRFPPSDAGTPTPASVTSAKNLVVYGNTAGTGTPLVSGLTVARVDWCDSYRCADHKLQSTGSGTVNLVTVKVTGVPFTSLVPGVVADLTFGTISATMSQVL